jgi:2',3'-cyclic-nucleotide 2'-phosphodiesterase (5'-nucleotidase family)
LANWERREADTLAEAIAKHLKKSPDRVVENQLLVLVQKAVDEASTTISTTPGELTRFRALVCTACRAGKLYGCDVPQGWSENCAFVYSNTTEFGQL